MTDAPRNDRAPSLAGMELRLRSRCFTLGGFRGCGVRTTPERGAHLFLVATDEGMPHVETLREEFAPHYIDVRHSRGMRAL